MQYEGVVDVFQTVRALRTQRPAMVQTEDQYQFCYRAALEYLSSFDTPYPEWHTAVLELGVWNRYVILRLSTSPLPPYVTFRLNVSTVTKIWKFCNIDKTIDLYKYEGFILANESIFLNNI